MNSIPQPIAVKLDVENIKLVMKNISDSFAEIQKEFDKYKDKRDYGFRFILHSIFLNNFKDNETYKLVESIANKKGRQIFYKEGYSNNRDYATFEKSLLSLHFNKNEQIINSIVNDVKSLLPKSNLDDEFILDCSINSTIFKAYCGFKKEIEIQSILNQIFKDNNSFLRVFGTNQIVDTKEKTDLYIPIGGSFDRSIKLQIKSKTFFNYRFPQTDQLGSIRKMKDLKGYFLFYDKDTNKICKLNGTIFANSDDVMKSFDGYGGKSSFEVATIEEIKMELFKIVNDYDRIK